VRRRNIVSAIVGVVVLFIVGGVLARVFSLGNAEQAAVTDLIIAEASGDRARMVSEIDGCAASPTCNTAVARYAVELKHAGEVKVGDYNPSAGFSLSSTTGVARIAWEAGSSKPIVQCVEVHRSGNVLAGQTIHLLILSAPINGGDDCPRKIAFLEPRS
jgi:hypothetical protein